MFETFLTAIVSTAHLTKETADAMEKGEELEGVAYDKLPYGYRVYLINETAPEGSEAICKAAAKQGCRWLEFDCDGPTVPGFPTYYW